MKKSESKKGALKRHTPSDVDQPTAPAPLATEEVMNQGGQLLAQPQVLSPAQLVQRNFAQRVTMLLCAAFPDANLGVALHLSDGALVARLDLSDGEHPTGITVEQHLHTHRILVSGRWPVHGHRKFAPEKRESVMTGSWSSSDEKLVELIRDRFMPYYDVTFDQHLAELNAWVTDQQTEAAMLERLRVASKTEGDSSTIHMKLSEGHELVAYINGDGQPELRINLPIDQAIEVIEWLRPE